MTANLGASALGTRTILDTIRPGSVRNALGIVKDMRAGPILSTAVLGMMCWIGQAQAQPTPTQDNSPSSAAPRGAAPETAASEQWAVRGQSTLVYQYHPAFRSAYRGPNSLDPGSRGNETFDLTLYGGFRPWRNAEVWANPEVDQGFGLSNTLGVAGFTSGEAYKVGQAVPYARLHRVFFRQTINLGADMENVAPDLNQLGGSQAANRLVLTMGKFSVVDVFDTNKYAHDPRNDFSNWAIIDIGTFDYAADSWGYSYGASLEWYQGRWTARTGVFALSREPNSKALDTSGSQAQFVGELEERHTLFGQPGKIKGLAFVSRGRFGAYADATRIALATGTSADISTVRNYRSKIGGGLNLEQQVANGIGVFARAGITQGDLEAYDFTDITRTVSLGISISGDRWGRPDDTLGVAVAINGTSRKARNFYNAGGLGILIGDGRLPNARPEQILEAYYSFAAFSFAKVAADYQFINNPAYNQDRGPVSVFGFRLHGQF